MTTSPPGWYANPRGELQWWDGSAWGVLAHQRTAVSKSPVSRFVWIAYCCSVLALFLWGLSVFLSTASVQSSAEVGRYDSSMSDADSMMAASGVLGTLAPLLAACSLAFAIIGLVYSQKKKASTFALALSTVVLASPVLYIVGALLFGFVSGTSS